MTDGYAAQAAKLAGVAERMAALAERLDRGARLVNEGTDESGRVSVAVDRAGLAETIRIRADWRSVIAASGLPHTISSAYAQALSSRMTAALEPSRDRFGTESREGTDSSTDSTGSTGSTDSTHSTGASEASFRVSMTTVPGDHLARGFDRLSAQAWEQMESLQRRAAIALAAPPTGTGVGAAGRVTVVVGIDLRLTCRIDDRWAEPQTGAVLMNTLNPALHAARDDLAGVSDDARFPTAGADCSALLDEFLALLNDPHRFADELAGGAVMENYRGAPAGSAGAATRLVTSVLRAHADLWDGSSQELSQHAGKVGGLTLQGQHPGPFAGFVPGYEGLVDALHDRLAEGAAATAAIADTLARVCNLYDAQDSEHSSTLSRMHEDG